MAVPSPKNNVLKLSPTILLPFWPYQGSVFIIALCAFFVAFGHFWVFGKDLPVFDQLLPDYFPLDLCADPEQFGVGGVRVVEAVQQTL